MSELTAQVKAEVSEAAGFLLPIALEHFQTGVWPAEPAAWLEMIRDCFAQREASEIH